MLFVGKSKKKSKKMCEILMHLALLTFEIPINQQMHVIKFNPTGETKRFGFFQSHRINLNEFD